MTYKKSNISNEILMDQKISDDQLLYHTADIF